MKNTLCLFATAILIAGTSIGADEITAIPGTASDTANFASPKPFQVEINYNAIGEAKFKNDDHKDQHIIYRGFDAEGWVGFWYNPCYKEGAAVGLGYSDDTIDWKENPYFKQKRFKMASLLLGAFTERAQDWLWKAKVAINVDTDHFDLNNYGNYDLTLWGRYQYTCNVGLHVGLFVLTGMMIDRVYPVLGFDWQISRNLKLNAVFPFDISAEYQIWNGLSAVVGTRFFYSRDRTGNNEPVPQALYEYRSTGVEAGLNYSIWGITANVHVGTMTGGKLTLSNRHHNDKKHLKFESANYAGASLEATF